MNSQILFPFILSIICLISCAKDSPDSNKKIASNNEFLFSLLSPEETGIDFQNTLTEGLNTNILMYEYFYNGGGVAAADLNGDDLLDLYFTSNMSDNKIFLNKGNFKFEDISLICGAQGRPGPWKTGVNIVDINGDKKMDIYICHSGSLPDEKRKNELLINQGNNVRGIPQFIEQAAAYGLDSPGFSTMAYFFDYDKDGDLDMILLNHNPKNLPMLNEESTSELLKQDDVLRGTRLYQNTNNRFEDVTVKAGINGSPLSYGLGIGISDLNNDSWPDFYVSNDYNIPDYLYINTKNGSFTNQLATSIDHTSQFSMGNDIADVNNDGWSDIFTLDMLPEDNKRQKLLLAPDNFNKFELNVRSGFYYQYMRNMLHLNQANGRFIEIGQWAGISNTDWSWSALFTDFDNDGVKDLHITNGYKRDYTNLDFINYMDEYVKSKGRLMREDAMQMIEQMPSSNISNYIFSGSDSLKFTNQSTTWGIHRPSNSNGAVYADLDNDGDQDLVVNNINSPAFIYRNELQTNSHHHYIQIKLNGQEKNKDGIGAKISVWTKDKAQYVEQYPARGYQSTISPIVHFGIGAYEYIDTITIQWPDGKVQFLNQIKSNQRINLDYKDAQFKKSILRAPSNTVFTEIQSPIQIDQQKLKLNDFDRQLLLIEQLSHTTPCLSANDINKDGLTDILFGGDHTNPPIVFVQQKGFQFQKLPLIVPGTYNKFIGSKPITIDIENDGDLDIIIPASGYHDFEPKDTMLRDLVYINTGNLKYAYAANVLPVLSTSKSKIVSIDINQDGFEDLFAAGRCVPGLYPKIPSSYILLNNKQGAFTDETQQVAPEIASIGMITDAQAIDLNNDKLKDLVLVGEWTGLKIFINVNGILIDQTSKFIDQSLEGLWNTVFIDDLNNDHKPDFVLGNHGLNSQLTASETKPIRMYYADFDKNGSIDPILETYIQDKPYPYITRDELVKQLSYLKPKFNSYKSYAEAGIYDLFTKEQIAKANQVKVVELGSIMYLSNFNNTWEKKSLPAECQYAPIYQIETLDFNKDGFKDLVLTGNNSNYKIRVGQMDANHGVLLHNDGTGQFKYITQSKSGLTLKGDVKSIVKLNDSTFLFGINEKPMRAFQLVHSDK